MTGGSARQRSNVGCVAVAYSLRLLLKKSLPARPTAIGVVTQTFCHVNNPTFAVGMTDIGGAAGVTKGDGRRFCGGAEHAGPVFGDGVQHLTLQKPPCGFRFTGIGTYDGHNPA